MAPLEQIVVTNMKTKSVIAAAVLFLGGTSSALCYDITSDPDATMNQEQKLGPNVQAYRVWNKIYVLKTPYYRRYVYRYWR